MQFVKELEFDIVLFMFSIRNKLNCGFQVKEFIVFVFIVFKQFYSVPRPNGSYLVPNVDSEDVGSVSARENQLVTSQIK